MGEGSEEDGDTAVHASASEGVRGPAPPVRPPKGAADRQDGAVSPGMSAFVSSDVVYKVPRTGCLRPKETVCLTGLEIGNPGAVGHAPPETSTGESLLASCSFCYPWPSLIFFQLQ